MLELEAHSTALKSWHPDARTSACFGNWQYVMLCYVNGLDHAAIDCNRCKPTVMGPGTPYCLEPDIPCESSQGLIGHSHRGTDAEYAAQALPNVRLSHGSSPSTTRK